MSTNPQPESNPASAPSSSTGAPKPPIEPLRLPTPDEVRGQDIWNNCAVRSVFSGVVAAECIVEKARAKHDTTNTAVAGCVTGGVLSATGGPKAACLGCAGFAAFSVAIEKFMDRHD